MTKATLKNTRDALAAAFLLNVMPDPAVLMLAKFGIVRADYLGKGVGVAVLDDPDPGERDLVLLRHPDHESAERFRQRPGVHPVQALEPAQRQVHDPGADQELEKGERHDPARRRRR